MKEITAENFESQVLQASLKTPVLLAFYSPRSEICTTLISSLEKIESTYQGGFILAKVNYAEQASLAQACNVRTIPTCILLIQGQLVNGFTENLPEGDIKKFLDENLPSDQEIVAHEQELLADDLLQNGQVDEAIAALKSSLENNPDNVEIRLDLIKLLLKQAYLKEVNELLQPMLGQLPPLNQFESLYFCLHAQEIGQTITPTIAQKTLVERIKSQPRDFDTRYQLACHLLFYQGAAQAMDELLEIVIRDKQWNDAIARKTIVGILTLLIPKSSKDGATKNATSSTIDLGTTALAEKNPEQQLVDTYRRRLSMALN